MKTFAVLCMALVTGSAFGGPIFSAGSDAAAPTFEIGSVWALPILDADSVADVPTNLGAVAVAPAAPPARRARPGRPASPEDLALEAYQYALAQRIVAVNGANIFAGRPQALLRSVVVLSFAIDANGKLVRSQIQRSNKDRVTESTALASLRRSVPFPKPAANLLRRGQLELSETWLFNKDGRFQLRTVAEPQMDH